MKEIKLGRLAGPYPYPPYEFFVQSPIGLIPKSGGKTRLIFHLSYNFKSGNPLVNNCTPDEFCTVKYHDFDATIRNCLVLIDRIKQENDSQPVNLYISKTDLVSAFRALPVKPSLRWLLCLKVIHPIMKKVFYCVDKNLPFGHSISCKLFNEVSNSLKHILEAVTNKKFVCNNYLDDYLLVEKSEILANQLVSEFLQICDQIQFPVSLEKTEWATLRMEFLGMLIDGEHKLVIVPQDKQSKAIKMLQFFSEKKKATVKKLQRLAGFLNFLTKAIVLGRTFLRCMYAKFAPLLKGKPLTVGHKKLHDYHHVEVDKEFQNDCKIWLFFLQENDTVCRPFVDFSKIVVARKLHFASDASRNPHLGFGTYFGTHWTFAQWEPGYIKHYKPSIEYLELYALLVGILLWGSKLANGQYIIWCDNKSTCIMVNNGMSSCKNCMFLLWVLALNNLRHNRRIFINYISMKANFLADFLSLLKLDKFHYRVWLVMDDMPTSLPPSVWPAPKIWIK